MATHSAITNAEIDVDSPITEALLRKYRDNPIADIEGDGTGVAFAALANISAGNIDLDCMAPVFPTNTTYAEFESWNVYKTGTYRITLYLGGTSSGTLYARIYQNGVAYGTERSVTTTDTTFTQDLSFTAGDTIQIYSRVSASGAGAGGLAARISISAPYYANIHSPGLVLS